jgi:hypothetical protein
MTEPKHATPDYRAGLTSAIEGEIAGEAYFERLAEFHSGTAARSLRLMADIERAVIRALQPATRHPALTLGDPEALRRTGRDEADAMGAMTWPQVLDRIVEEYPLYVAEFEALAALAPSQEAAADAHLLVDHEIAFIDFARAARAGQPESEAILSDFLARCQSA